METQSASINDILGEPAIVINGVPNVAQTDNSLSIRDSTSDAELKKNPLLGEWFVDRLVQKKFGKKLHSGSVKNFDRETGWYRVVYEDGDFEDLEFHELEEVLLPLDITYSLQALALKMLRKYETLAKVKKHATASIILPCVGRKRKNVEGLLHKGLDAKEEEGERPLCQSRQVLRSMPQPAPVLQQPPPVPQQPVPVRPQLAPVLQQPSSVIQQPVSVLQQSAPVLPQPQSQPITLEQDEEEETITKTSKMRKNNFIRKINSSSKPNCEPPIMPENMRETIISKGGTDIKFVFEKNVAETDTRRGQNRLTLPEEQVEKALTEREKIRLNNKEDNTMEVLVLDPKCRVWHLTFKRWISIHKYVLITYWFDFVKGNDIKPHVHKVEVWSFRQHGSGNEDGLCFAINVREQESEDDSQAFQTAATS